MSSLVLADGYRAPVSPPLEPEEFEAFKAHPWVRELGKRISDDSALAQQALARIIQDLGAINRTYVEQHGRTALVSVEGRVKQSDSLLLKLQRECRRASGRTAVTQEMINKLYGRIHDLCGVRFACPYLDEVRHIVEELIRPGLQRLGYASDLRPRLKDKDDLDEGDEWGYRSYHFFVQVPTPVDIYGKIKLRLCEVQARTELQHVWAVKSHDLLFKPGTGVRPLDRHVTEDMRQVSNSLRAADQFLQSVRDRVSRQGGSDAVQ
jgi:ppGpp synthetase/RelA/SpoT-type nucleotidyltranferase